MRIGGSRLDGRSARAPRGPTRNGQVHAVAIRGGCAWRGVRVRRRQRGTDSVPTPRHLRSVTSARRGLRAGCLRGRTVGAVHAHGLAPLCRRNQPCSRRDAERADHGDERRRSSRATTGHGASSKGFRSRRGDESFRCGGNGTYLRSRVRPSVSCGDVVPERRR